jgi:hypothetical protein
VEDTLETELVALEGSERFTEKLLRVLVAAVDTGNIDLLPLDGYVVGLEDGLDRLGNFSTDTVTLSSVSQDQAQCNEKEAQGM